MIVAGIILFIAICTIWILTYKPPEKLDYYYESDDYKIIERIRALSVKKERICDLIELMANENDRDSRELVEKQKAIYKYINEYYYKYCALLLRCYAVKYTDRMKLEFEKNSIDGLVLIKEMKKKIEDIYNEVVGEYDLSGNEVVENEMSMILRKIQEIINSVAVVETRKIVESLSPIDEKNSVIQIVNSKSSDFEYSNMKTILDQEYERFLAENEINNAT